MTDAQTTILYALSTLAQTCAALAAFVGAVGLYRLQSLRGRQRDLLREITAGMGPADAQVLVAQAKQWAQDNPQFTPLIQEYEEIPACLRASRRGLIVFEGWNLLVIGASLVGFNYVLALAASPLTFWALWLAAVGTVAVTVYCVFAWTRG